MTKIFRFPGGAGGHWLQHIIFCLENETLGIDNPNSINFHDYQFSKNVYGDHFADPYDFLLSTTYKFNLYINGMIKNPIEHIPDDWFKNTDDYVRSARHHHSLYWKRFYETNIDLDISLTSLDPENFIDDLFKILDLLNISYTPNKELIYKKINAFVKTCPDTSSIIGDLENDYWLAWSLGMLPENDVLITYQSKDQVKQFIEKHHDFCIEQTLKCSYVDKYLYDD